MEQLEPATDLREVIGDPLRRRQPLGPVPGLRIRPRLVRQEGDAAGARAAAQHVPQGEVLQGVGADLGLGGLDGAAGLGRHQLGADLGVQDGQQRAADGVVEQLFGHHPADEVLDEGLGDAGVDAVVGHLVAHPEGAPAQGELGEVPGAQDDAAAVVGDAEEEVGAQARLDVLEGDVVEVPLARSLGQDTGAGVLAVGVAHLGEHLGGGGPDVELLEGAAQADGEVLGVAACAGARGEAGHGDGVDVRAGPAQAVHGAGGDDEGVGGVQAAADTDDDLGVADGPQALDEGGHLDVVGLVAVLGEAGRIVGHEGEAVHTAAQTDVRARSRQLGDTDPDAPEGRRVGEGGGRGRGTGDRGAQGAAVVGEGPLAQALGAQALDVDVDDGGARPVGEALGGGEQLAVLVDEGLPVPGQVGGGLALSGGGVDVGGQPPGRRRAGQQLTVLGPPHRDGRAREVDQDRRPGQRRHGGGRDGHPHVLADLDVEGQAGDIVDLEQEVRPEGDPGDRLGTAGAVGAVSTAAHAGQLNALHPGRQGVAGSEVPLLVELPVRGQVGLGGDTAHPPALDDQGAVVEAVAQAQGRADDEGGQEVGAGGAQGLDGGEHVGQQDVGQQEVVDGVARQAQLGEGGQADAILGQGAGLVDDGGGVGGRVDGHHRQGDGGDAGEALVVGGEELNIGRCGVHGVGHGSILPSTAPSCETAALVSRPGALSASGRTRPAARCSTVQRTAPTASPVEPGVTRSVSTGRGRARRA